MEALLIITSSVAVIVSTLSAAYVFRLPNDVVARKQLGWLLIVNAVLVVTNSASLLVEGDLQVWLARVTMIPSVTSLYFTYTFSRAAISEESKKSISMIIAALIVSATTLTPWFFTGTAIKSTGYAIPVAGPLVLVFGAYALFVVVKVAVDYVNAFKDTNLATFKRKKMLLLGLVHVFTYSYLFVLVFLFSNTIGDVRFLYMAGLIFSFQAIGLMYVYTRYNLHDVQQVVQAKLTRITIGIFVATLFVALIYLLQNLFIVSNNLVLAAQFTAILFSIWLVSVLFRWLDSKETIELPDKVDPLTTNLTESVLRTIVEGVAETLQKDHGVTNFELFLLDYEREQFVEYGVDAIGNDVQRAFSQDHPLVKSMFANKRGQRTPVLDLRHKNETKLMEDSSASAAIPLHTNQGVYGVVLVHEANDLSESQMEAMIEDYAKRGHAVGQHLEYILRNHYIVTSTSKPRK